MCGTIHNCCLEAENELENSLPTLLLPVAGKKVDELVVMTILVQEKENFPDYTI